MNCLWPLETELGEGPIWSAAEQALWFVDIKGKRIHRYGAGDGAQHSWDAPSNPGFLAPVAGGGFIAGLKSGLHRFDPETGAFDLLAEVEPHRPGNRLNDGCVDAQGRLWFGSMHDGERDLTGVLYRMGPTGALTACGHGYCITNGPAISPDGRTLYHTDTLQRVIWAFDLDEDGHLSGKRLFARVETGYPDGPVVDQAGHVWTGLFGGWGLNRYAPDGRLVEHVRFPCANVTKPAFGGEDLMTVYATTAWKGLSPTERAEQPLAGGLFAFRADTPGQPQYEVRLG